MINNLALGPISLPFSRYVSSIRGQAKRVRLIILNGSMPLKEKPGSVKKHVAGRDRSSTGTPGFLIKHFAYFSMPYKRQIMTAMTLPVNTNYH